MMVSFAVGAVLSLAMGLAGQAADRPVNVVGSSTVSPFVVAVAELLDDQVRIEMNQNGTSLGLARLCASALGGPDIAAASRRILRAEMTACAEVGVKELVEMKIGLDGIVIAQSEKALPIELSARDVYLALAARTPLSDQECRLVMNRRKLWSDVRDDLPEREILVIGPPMSSGTRQTFAKLVLEEGARAIPCLRQLEAHSPTYFESALEMRRDGQWIDGGENDHAIAHTLRHLRAAIGIFGYAHLFETDGIEAISYEGVLPTAETVATGVYPLSRPLYLYTTILRLQSRPGIETTLAQFAAPSITGPRGRLTRLGLISVPQSGGVLVMDAATGEVTSTSLSLGQHRFTP